MIGTPEIIVIVLVVLLLFGGRKIPELMRGLGRGVRSFKDGVNGVDEPDDRADTRNSGANAGRAEADNNRDSGNRAEAGNGANNNRGSGTAPRQ